MWWSYIVGYLFGVVIAHFPISLVVDQMWECIGWTKGDEEIRPQYWLPRILGCVERALYVASFQLGKPEFIGVWLALKVAGGWKRWTEDKEHKGRIITGRAVYNIFLIGNALSIAYAAVGAKLVEWCSKQEWLFVIGGPVCLFLATLALFCWSGRYRRAS